MFRFSIRELMQNATPKGSPSEAQGRTLRAHPGYLGVTMV
jgi:hypothetical protein